MVLLIPLNFRNERVTIFFEILSINQYCCFLHPFFLQLNVILLFEDYILWYFNDLIFLFSIFRHPDLLFPAKV